MGMFTINDYRRISSAVQRVENTPYRDANVDPADPPIQPPPIAIRRFELKNDLTADGGWATAYMLERDRDRRLDITAETFEVCSFTGWTGRGRDTTNPERPIPGTRGLAVHLYDLDMWEVVSDGSHLRRFELKADLTADNTATDAYLLYYDPITEICTIGEENRQKEIQVISITGFRGRGRVVDGSQVTNGSRGWCIKRNGRWEVVGDGTGCEVALATLQSQLMPESVASATFVHGGNGMVEVNSWLLDTCDTLAVNTKVAIARIGDTWYVIQPITSDKLALATLNATLDAGGTAAATLAIGGSDSITVNGGLLHASDRICSGDKIVVARIAGTWYYISHHAGPIVLATLQATLNAGSMASAVINAGAQPSMITVADWWLKAGTSLPVSTKVIATKIEGVWYVLTAAGTTGTTVAIATLTEKLNAGSYAAATVNVGGSGSVSVSGWLLSSGQSLASGTKVVIAFLGGNWYAISWASAAGFRLALATLGGDLEAGDTAYATIVVGGNESVTVSSWLLNTGQTIAGGSKIAIALFQDTWQYISSVDVGTPVALATLSATLNSGSTASATVNVGGSGSVTVDGRMLGSGETLASGTKVTIVKIGSTWYVISWPQVPIALATLGGELEAGGTAYATISVGGSESVTVKDWWLPSGKSLAGGTKIAIAKIAGEYYVICAWVQSTFIRDIQLGSTHLQIKTADALCCWVGSDSDWQNKIQITECSE